MAFPVGGSQFPGCLVTISHSDSSPRIGQTIAGKFVIEAVIAIGGIGTVYRARQLGLDRLVAVKLLRPVKYREVVSLSSTLGFDLMPAGHIAQESSGG